jgi:lipopolysaccharide/colanic/teichoic acid biosynthesis glycosyltransferase
MTPSMPRTFYARRGKRVLDLVVSLAALAVLSPLLLLIVAAIKLDSRGCVFYRQERIGRDGRPFGLWKFRSMVVGAEHRGAGILVERDDARITRIGKWIRKLSLDEIPQLFNVVTGDMSIVGPRPGMRYQVELYDAAQRGRLAVRPGVTGWAQVNGRNAIEWPRRIELDLEYIERMTLALDLRIMLRTIPSVLAGGDMIAGRDYWKEKAREREAARHGD